ncbi:hypothetical protein M1N17_03250, partial [Dehalococcoidia bacterium]|nr:hypothetical protein [Dehalococcoidia bacterium]
GIAENMSGGVFGTGGGEDLAKEMNAPFLGALSVSPAYMDETQLPSLHDQSIRDEYETLSEKTIKQLEELQTESN